MCPNGNMKDLVWDNSFEREKIIAPGSLLISEPFMEDENFKKSIILICEHGKEEGTLGFVLNHPTEFMLSDLIDDVKGSAINVNFGGPCELDSLHYIHTLGEQIPDSTNLGNGLYWGGEFEVVIDMINNGIGNDDNIRFYLGFSGWTFDQLMQELEESSWIIGHSSKEIIFDYPPTEMWQRVLKGMGTAYKILSNYPENPSLN